MTLRPLFGAASTLLIAAAASAQTDVQSKLMPLPGPIQDGGVYDVASGTWSSDLSAQAASAQVLYDNTCVVNSYLSLSTGERTVDTGRLPSTTSPTDFLSVTGTANDYDMLAVRLAYVTSEPTVDLSVNLYQCFDACGDPRLGASRWTSATSPSCRTCWPTATVCTTTSALRTCSGGASSR
jgi:hypothetical protein